jgi:hypothetical protein
VVATPADLTVAAVFSGPASTAAEHPADPPSTSVGETTTTAAVHPPSGSPSPTPEPATMLLMAGGLAFGYGARRFIR